MTTYEKKSKSRGDSEESFTGVVIGYTHVLCCPCCDFCTLSSPNLYNHAMSHDSETLSSYNTYTCSKCKSTSTERRLMLEHVNLYHNNSKNPVELTEEIHTITRKEEFIEEEEEYLRRNDCKNRDLKHSLMKTKSKRSQIKVERNLKKIKWRSRINRIKNFGFNRWQNKEILKNSSQNIEEYYRDGETEQRMMVDEPLDMSVKTQQKLEAFNNNGSLGDKPTMDSSIYPSLYNNIKSHFLDIFTKSPLTASISNPILMRYLTSHLHSITDNKYFTNEMFPQRSDLQPDNRHPTTNDIIYQHNDQHQHMKISMSKFQSCNSTSSSTPHRSLHRNNFTPFQNHILLEWYDKHKNKPYPSTEDTKHLSTLCGLSYPQVKKWFANKRARSTFYQKNDMISCDDDIRCDMLRFPLRVTNRVNVDIARSMEAQFRKSMGNKMPNVVGSRMPLH